MTETNQRDDLESDEPTSTERFGLDRRTLMKVFGAGTALSLGVAPAAATRGSQPNTQPNPPSIDPYYGYPTPNPDQHLPKNLQPDHTIDLDIEFGPNGPKIPFHFDPMGLHICPGDVVKFNFVTPEHTVTAYGEELGRQQRVPDGVPTYSSPVVTANGFWLYRFDKPGTYDMFCAPHEPFGMVMRLVVGDPGSDSYDGDFGGLGTVDPVSGPEFRPPLSADDLNGIGLPADSWPFPLPADIFATDAMSVQNIVDAGTDGVSVEDVGAELNP